MAAGATGLDAGQVPAGQFQILLPTSSTTVTLSHPELRDSWYYSTYAVYEIQCPKYQRGVTVDKVWRRYSDFKWLRDVLRKQFPAVFLPMLPPKGNIVLQSQRKASLFLTERLWDLERFINRLESLPFVRDSRAFRAFICDVVLQTETIDKEVGLTASHKAKSLFSFAMTPELDHACGIRDTRAAFPGILQQPVPEGVALQLANLQDFLQNAVNVLTDITDSCRSMHFHSEDLAEGVSNMRSELRSLASIETLYQECPSPMRLSVNGPLDRWGDTEGKNSRLFDKELLCSFKYQLHDFLSILELIHDRTECIVRRKKAVPQSVSYEQESKLLHMYNVLTLGYWQATWKGEVARFQSLMRLFCLKQLEVQKRMSRVWSNLADSADAAVHLNAGAAALPGSAGGEPQESKEEEGDEE